MTAEGAALALGLAVFTGLMIPSPVARRSAVRAGNLVKASTLSPLEWRQYQRERASWYDRWARPLTLLWAHRLRLRPARVDRLFLIQAGVDPDRFTGLDLRALKLAGALVGVLLSVVLATIGGGFLAFTPLLAWAGYIAPNRFLASRRRQRERRILEELPDFIGLIRAFTIAGVPLERALHLIASQEQFQVGQPILTAEVRSALSRYGLGASMQQSLEEMADRLGVDEFRLFVAALSQGRRLGIGLAQMLRDQELMARMNQRNRSTAEASRVGTKLLGVLAGVYLPEFVILIMVPMFWGIIHRAFG